MVLTERNVPPANVKTEPICEIENALVRPARRPLHTDGLPLRPLRE